MTPTVEIVQSFSKRMSAYWRSDDPAEIYGLPMAILWVLFRNEMNFEVKGRNVNVKSALCFFTPPRCASHVEPLSRKTGDFGVSGAARLWARRIRGSGEVEADVSDVSA
jgi:hypothetical protein